MQKHHVTIGEETYPLPEAQLDRFMFNIRVNYPKAEEEESIIKRVTGTYRANIEKQLNGETVLKLQDVVRRVPPADHVVSYAAQIARASRPKEDGAPDFIKEMVSWGRALVPAFTWYLPPKPVPFSPWTLSHDDS